MSQLDLDPQFTQGLKLMHSSNKDSAEQLRALLDEIIKQKHGQSKMLCNVLHKKYTVEEAVLSDNSSGSSSKRSKSSSSSSKHSNKSSKNSSPVNLPLRLTPDILQQNSDNEGIVDALDLLDDDLQCVICKGMDVSARNKLVECNDCHALYHQECHTPHISDSQIDVLRAVWYCCNCSKQPSSSTKDVEPVKSSDSKPKEHKKSSSSSKHSADKHKSSSSSSSQNGSSSSSKQVPHINIVQATDKRLRDMMKKAKQDKRSSSSSNSGSSSKYSSSSSGKSDKSSLHKMKD